MRLFERFVLADDELLVSSWVAKRFDEDVLFASARAQAFDERLDDLGLIFQDVGWLLVNAERAQKDIFTRL